MSILSNLGSTIQKSLPSWEKTKTTSKQGFDAAWAQLDKLGKPVNKLSHKLGSEAFWPTTMDKESDKAARILRSFCKDGFYADLDGDSRMAPEAPKGKQRVVKKIPAKIIQQAKGLAIFTTCRTGLWVSGAGGSGILVARKEDGTWSPPSGILLHTAGLGFLVGVDIYDCVVVINTEAALNAFTKVRCTLGGEVSAVAGPVGVGGILETEIHKRQAPIWTYLKSRGFYAGVQVDGTIIIERTDENERFYGQRIGVADILKGKVRHPPPEINMLMNTIKYAQGDTDINPNDLPDDEPTQGDLEIHEVVDDDPFGIHALEKEGMEIKELNTTVSPIEQPLSLGPVAPKLPPPPLPARNTPVLPLPKPDAPDFTSEAEDKEISVWDNAHADSVVEREAQEQREMDMKDIGTLAQNHVNGESEPDVRQQQHEQEHKTEARPDVHRQHSEEHFQTPPNESEVNGEHQRRETESPATVVGS